MAADGVLDTIARGLARGMSRREALRVGAGAVVGVVAASPADALARVTGRCTHHRVKCDGRCCPPGEVCIHAKKHRHRKTPKPKCGCPPSTRRCGSACVRLGTDPKNCGLCGHHCPHGSHCHNGNCLSVCPAGTTQCLGGCVNLSTDQQNCGTCGAACAAGTACANGTCVSSCPAGTVTCGSSCVQVGSDPDNCGACGNACPGGQACVDGTCTPNCPSSQTLCGRVCANLQGDGANCGKCGVACPSGTVCANGICSSAGCPGGSVTCDQSCCQGNGCCNGGCQTVHTNGVGQSFYDCGSVGVPGKAATYSLALAQEAANAFAPGASTHTCGPDQALIVVDASGQWATWIYTGPLAGRVHLDAVPICPNATDPIWN